MGLNATKKRVDIVYVEQDLPSENWGVGLPQCSIKHHRHIALVEDAKSRLVGWVKRIDAEPKHIAVKPYCTFNVLRSEKRSDLVEHRGFLT